MCFHFVYRTVVSNWDVIDTQCQYNGSPCSSFNTCITGEATFTYKLKNTGNVCNDVDKITVSFGSDGARTLALDAQYKCSDRESCPGDVWTLSEKRFVNTCSSSNAQILLNILVKNGSATAMDYWSGPSGPSAITPSAPAPTPPVSSPTTSQCTTDATQLIFAYHGGHSCRYGHDRKRNLRSRSSNKSKKEPSYTTTTSHSSSTTTSTSVTTTIISHVSTAFCDCIDFAYTNASQVVNIEVTSKNEKVEYGHFSDHHHGNQFTITSGASSEYLKNNLTMKIYNDNGHIVQEINVNTGGKCLEDMVGKPMGSLTLIGWVP